MVIAKVKLKFHFSMVIAGFPDSSVGKQSACNAGDPCWIPGLGRSLGEAKGQCSGLENSMDCLVYWFAKSRTQLNNFHFHDYCRYVI